MMSRSTYHYRIRPRRAFQYALEAIGRIPGFSIDKIDQVNMRILASTGVSGFSWGEDIVVEVRAQPYGVSLTVRSEPKLVTNIFALGSTRKNVKDFFRLFDNISGLSPIRR